MEPQFLMNGAVHGISGSAFEILLANDLDENALRPFVGKDGRSYIQRRVSRDPVTQKSTYKLMLTNAPATLTKDAWIDLDREVQRISKERMAAWNALVGMGGVRYVNDAMGTPILQYQTTTDITGATISMDGLRKSERDRPQYDIAGFPLPIIHKDLGFSLREIAVSRRGGQPVDTQSILLAVERVSEEVEKLTLGVSGSYSYGGYTIYGYTNHPARVTRSILDPSEGGWSMTVTKNDILAMKQSLIDRYHYGPYDLYFGTSWNTVLDDDYLTTYSAGTLRDRLGRIDGIENIRVLDYLPGYNILLVERSASNVRAVIGMRTRTLQWTNEGGLEQKMKVMCIQAPQIRPDSNGNVGIVHAS